MIVRAKRCLDVWRKCLWITSALFVVLGMLAWVHNSFAATQAEEEMQVATQRAPQSSFFAPKADHAWQKHVGSFLSWGVSKAVRLLCWGAEKIYQGGVWVYHNIDDRSKVSVARTKAIDRVLDNWVKKGFDERLQAPSCAEFVTEEVMRQKVKQATQEVRWEEVCPRLGDDYINWNCARSALKEALGLTQAKRADALRKDVSTKKIVNGLLRRLTKKNRHIIRTIVNTMADANKDSWRLGRPHWPFSWCKMSSRKKTAKWLVKGLKRPTSWLGFKRKNDENQKALLKDFTDDLSGDRTLSWDEQTDIYRSWDINYCPRQLSCDQVVP